MTGFDESERIVNLARLRNEGRMRVPLYVNFDGGYVLAIETVNAQVN